MSRPKGSKNKPKITNQEEIKKLPSKEEALESIRNDNIQAESTPIQA